MTLLCSSVLALLLLPLSLSCNSKRLPQEVRRDYELVKIDLHNSRQNVITLLQNSSCPDLRYKLRRCASNNNTDFIMTARRRMANGKRQNQRQTKKLCRAKTVMDAMTECYEMLNAQGSTAT